MRHVYIFAAITFALMSTGCDQKKATQEEGKAAISLHVKNGDGESIVLEDVNTSVAIPLDTAAVEKGKAHLSAALQPGIYRLRTIKTPKPQMPLLILDNETDLHLEIDLNDPLAYSIKDDPANELLRSILMDQNEVRIQSTTLIQSIQTTSDLNVRQDLIQQHEQLVNSNGNNLKGAVESSKAYDPNLTAFLLNFLDPNANGPYIQSELEKLKEQDPDSRLVAEMMKRFQPQQGPGGIAIGNVAPDIIQESPSGTPLKLSSLRGSYVLIDFWASWCKPCRIENPNVVRTYNEYKDKGFDIFSVSLDKSKDRWIKAIEDDNLVWNSHVSDLQGWSNAAARLYGVGSIPATFLIDPEGKVIARNLRGNALENKLMEIFDAQ